MDLKKLAESQMAVLGLVMTVASAVASAFVWVVTESRTDSEKEWERARLLITETESRYEKIIDQEQKNTDLWRTRAIESQSRETQLLEENTRLRLAQTGNNINPIEIAKTIIARDPGFSWVKIRYGKLDYRMITVSRGYAQQCLVGPSSIYEGKSDFDIWPQDVAELFAQNDELAYVQGSITVEEQLKGNCDGAQFVGRKWLVQIPSGPDLIFGAGRVIR